MLGTMTGFASQDYSYLEPDVAVALGAGVDGLFLFRQILPPRVPVRPGALQGGFCHASVGDLFNPVAPSRARTC